MMQMNLYDVKEVGNDFIVLTDGRSEVRITFEATPEGVDFINPTKEEHAAFFSGIKCQVGLEAPVRSSQTKRTLNSFLDHQVIDYGFLRSVPFPVARLKSDDRHI
jgi:hypothetical protein